MGCGGVSGYGEELHSNNATAQNMEVPYSSPLVCSVTLWAQLRYEPRVDLQFKLRKTW